MNCPFCGAELPDDATVCPECGKTLNGEAAEAADQKETGSEEAASQETASEETASEETASEETGSEETASGETGDEKTEAEEAPAEEDFSWKTCGKETPCEECPERVTCIILQEHTEKLAEQQLAKEKAEKKKKTQKLWKRIGIIAGACVAVAALAFGAYKLIKGPTIMHTNSKGFTSYTMTDKQATDRVLNRVVATCGDEKLTNRTLTYYYWQQYYSFANNYSSYLSSILDTSLGLDEQKYEDGSTWQKKFLDSAVTMFNNIAALNQEATKAGFKLDSDTEKYLSTISSDLDTAATQYGFKSGEEYLQQAFGKCATMDGYLAYARENLTASSYLQKLVSAESYTADDISSYFDSNSDTYTQQGITKDDVNMVDVRHILIVPTEQNSDGTYTDAAWTAAKEKAEALLKQWEDGDKTEESFASLATANSADTGSASNGGLITGVYPGEMVEDFNTWCFADGRKAGDYGIVKSEYGYHIVYLSAIEEHPHWYSVAESDYKNKLSMKIEDETTAKYETTVNYDNAAILDVLSTANASQTAADEQAAADATTSSAAASASGSAASSAAVSSASSAAASGSSSAK
jgi:parvulin-like peptidyl-prolyl isomerase